MSNDFHNFATAANQAQHCNLGQGSIRHTMPLSGCCPRSMGYQPESVYLGHVEPGTYSVVGGSGRLGFAPGHVDFAVGVLRGLSVLAGGGTKGRGPVCRYCNRMVFAFPAVIVANR